MSAPVPAFAVTGTGPAVIFVTGLGGLGGYWRHQVAALQDRYTVITYDQPGVGASAATPRPWSTRSWVQDLLAVADAAGVDRFAVVGHSTGGAIVQHAGADAADRIRGLVLSGTWALADERFRRVFDLRVRLLTELDAAAYAEIGAILSKPLIWPEGPAGGPTAGEATTQDVILDRIAALVGHDGREACSRIAAPTLILAAADDQLVPPNHARDLQDRIKGADLQLVADGGHHFPQTRPDWTNRHLETFLEGLA